MTIDPTSSGSFRAMGTEWWIGCDRPELVPEAELLVQDMEARLSRFRADSALSELNRERWAVDPFLAQVATAAVRMQQLTAEAFDPTLGAQLACLGYDRDWEEIDRSREVASVSQPTGGLMIRVRGHQVRLEGPGHLDLGGIAKGWTIDLVHDDLLRRGATRVLVDGGGDMRGTGGWMVGVGRDRAVRLDGGLATSSTRQRTWLGPAGQRFHHLLDPATGTSSASPVVEATVQAADATTADALATALIVAPEATLACLQGLGASAWISDREGREWITPDWKEAV